MRAILLIDHGSVRPEANHMLACMANLVQTMVGPEMIVRHAHMELAEPTIDQGLRDCADAGATDIVAFPYMLSPGKHSTRDIPRMVAESAAAFPHIQARVTPCFGVSERLAEVVLERAGMAPAAVESPALECRGWSPDESERACGAACRALTC